jgi:hypothetical protein
MKKTLTTICSLVAILSFAQVEFSGVTGFDNPYGSILVLEDLIGTVLWQGTPIPGADEYVQNGLVDMWDGIENAGWGEHDPNAMAWKDLVGANDLGKDQSGISWGPSYSQMSNSATHGWYKQVDISRSAVFVEAVFMVHGPPTTRGVNGIICCGGNNSTKKMEQIIVSQAGTLTIGSTGTRHRDISSDYNLILTVSARLYNSTALPWYFCGESVTTQTGTVPTNGSNTYLRLGTAWNGLNGRLYCVRIYNRVLSASEVEYNHSLDQARFGAE